MKVLPTFLLKRMEDFDMIFSTDILKSVSSNNIYNISNSRNNIDKIEESSLFIDTLKAISEDSRYFTSQFSEAFSIQEDSSFSSFVFKNTVGKLDFKKILTKILNWFIKLLEDIWNRFKSLLLNLFGQDKVVKHYKQDLENIKIPVRYTEDRFIFTNLGLNTSYTSYKTEIEKELSSLILDISKFKLIHTTEKIVSELEFIKQNIDTSENYYNEIRGYILGTRSPIMKGDFATELFKFFRNNGNPVNGPSIITPNEMKRICSDYFDFKKLLKEVQKDKQDMQNVAKDTIRSIQNINLQDYIKNDTLPKEVEKIFLQIVENKCTRIKNLCDIFLQVFSAKLDAIKEAANQNKKILYTACKTLIKEGEI